MHCKQWDQSLFCLLACHCFAECSCPAMQISCFRISKADSSLSNDIISCSTELLCSVASNDLFVPMKKIPSKQILVIIKYLDRWAFLYSTTTARHSWLTNAQVAGMACVHMWNTLHPRVKTSPWISWQIFHLALSPLITKPLLQNIHYHNNAWWAALWDNFSTATCCY